MPKFALTPLQIKMEPKDLFGGQTNGFHLMYRGVFFEANLVEGWAVDAMHDAPHAMLACLNPAESRNIARGWQAPVYSTSKTLCPPNKDKATIVAYRLAIAISS